jgi:NAD(P)-dependent dehydrogenase (short-subunit alcohol dehydrogenase family)
MQKTVLITGASSGFGKATALLFKQRGWNVAASMRKPKEHTSWTEGLFCPRLDVTEERSINSAVEKTVEQFGRIDALVNNAGYGLVGPLEGYSTQEFRRQLATNLLGAATVSRACLPYLRESKGVIVNISSVAGRVSFPLGSAYNASKWGLEGFTEAIQYELRPMGVRVKLVQPGGFKTDFGSRGMVWAEHPDYQNLVEAARKINNDYNAKAPGPEKVAETIYRAATDSSLRLRYSVNGQPVLLINKLLPHICWSALMIYLVRRGMQPKTVETAETAPPLKALETGA